ncbi:DUF3558 family protein [Mycobacteroides abscessus]|uniref:DUF3558 family protein n=1 Tax=Mycobacteroides abscessus TaxID=36809 RepID=UPI001F1CF3B1|nr:DUF3558 family protein [Mycobacteroides abscessus]
MAVKPSRGTLLLLPTKRRPPRALRAVRPFQQRPPRLPPHQAPNANTDGTSFDPCSAYSSAELNKWGLDPASVKGVDDGLQRGCIWNGKNWYVQQLVVNRSISEYLDTNNYPDAQPLTIAGLQGSQHRLSQPGTGFCSVQIPSQRAVVATLVTVDPEAAGAIPDACPKAIEIATDSAAKLPK